MQPVQPAERHPIPRAQPRRAPARPCPRFFVRAPATARVPEHAALTELLQRWVLRELSGWAQLVIVELIADGSVEWDLDAAHPSRAIGQRLISVRCVDRRGPRRPGLWAARTVATALAELLDGAPDHPRLRPPADARVHAIDHLVLPSAIGPDRRLRLASLGLNQFGLPDLELVGVGEDLREQATGLLLGVAQHLIDSAWVPPRDDRAREVLLTVGELGRALGVTPGTVPSVRGRGWTRVAVGVTGEPTWPALLRLGPPAGARGWSNTHAWLTEAWRDLAGGAAGVNVTSRA